MASMAAEVPLSLSDTLAIAGAMRFYPLVQCLPQVVVPKDTSFLGTLQKLRTGDVLQVGTPHRGCIGRKGCQVARRPDPPPPLPDSPPCCSGCPRLATPAALRRTVPRVATHTV